MNGNKYEDYTVTDETKDDKQNEFIKRKLQVVQPGERFVLIGECDKCKRVMLEETRREKISLFGYQITLCEICILELLKECNKTE